MRNVSPLTEGEQASRGWKVELNGESIVEVISFKVVQERMGISLEYGKTPAGYDGLALEEAGGGGTVVIPYVNIDGEIYVGMVEENRPFAGGTVLNVPRGFLNPGETHFETAKKELEEETGYTAIEKSIKPLEGEPMNPNSTFFVAKDPDKGVRPYKVSIEQDEVRLLIDSQNPRERVYEFNPEVIKPVSRMGERVMRSKFHHWTAALQVRDMFTVAGVGRLVKEEVLGKPTQSPTNQ